MKTTVVSNSIRTPILFINCGIGEKVYTRDSSDQIKEIEKREREETNKLTQQNETNLSVDASYAQAVSASVHEKLISSMEQTRRDYLMKSKDVQINHALHDEIKLPQHSVEDASVIETNSIDTYEVQGTVTTDVMLVSNGGFPTALGHWSDYWGSNERSFPVTVKFSIPIHSMEIFSKLDQYSDENSCLDAAAKWRTSAN